MNTKAIPELSYFRLKLTAYLRGHQPDLVDDATLVSSRSDAALTAYCDAVAQGFSHPKAESIASNVLFEGLHFSKYDTLVSVLKNEFEAEFPSPLPEKLAPILLRNKAVQRVFANYHLTDDFAANPQYEDLYTELTGTIVLIIEQNNMNYKIMPTDLHSPAFNRVDKTASQQDNAPSRVPAPKQVHRFSWTRFIGLVTLLTFLIGFVPLLSKLITPQVVTAISILGSFLLLRFVVKVILQITFTLLRYLFWFAVLCAILLYVL